MTRFLLNHKEVVHGAGFKDPLYKKYWGVEHLGTDYVAKYVPLYSHIELEVISQNWGHDGGHWLEMVGVDKHKLRIAHLDSYSTGKGTFKESTKLAVTGNTGAKTSGPHVHVEVINPEGKHIDPELYFNELLMKSKYEGKTIMTSEGGEEKGKWYFIKEGRRYWIPDKPTGWAWGFLEADIQWISYEAVAEIPHGGQLKYWEGYLFRLIDEIRKNKKYLPK